MFFQMAFIFIFEEKTVTSSVGITIELELLTYIFATAE